MFEHILSSEQMALAERLFPEVGDFYLAGGTGLALLIGHRRSLDFDLCSLNQIEIEEQFHLLYCFFRVFPPKKVANFILPNCWG